MFMRVCVRQVAGHEATSVSLCFIHDIGSIHPYNTCNATCTQVAGHETTGSLLTWTMFELAQNPEEMRKVRITHAHTHNVTYYFIYNSMVGRVDRVRAREDPRGDAQGVWNNSACVRVCVCACVRHPTESVSELVAESVVEVPWPCSAPCATPGGERERERELLKVIVNCI
jgi:hypothetical protein